MNYPLYLASDAKYFLNKWQSEIGRISVESTSKCKIIKRV